MIHKIITKFYSIKDSNRAVILSRFFKTKKGEYAEGDVFLGIRIPVIRGILKEYKDIEIKDTLILLKRKEHEIRLFALLVLVEKYRSGKDRDEIYNQYLNNAEYINNWDLIDVTAVNIVGDYLLNKDRSILYNLARSNSIWERRIAIISTFRFIKDNDFKDTIEISKLLLKDEHDLIHKAVGWMLREVYKRDKGLIISFLDEYGSTMPRVMLRYAIEKMDEELRQSYLHKGKKKSKL